VVHHPQAREAGGLGGTRHFSEHRGGGDCMTFKLKPRDLQSEFEAQWILLLAGGGVGRG
jgi:hypothetical protein